MANLRTVEGQEPRRLVDEDTDQHSHPLFRMSPGMKMLGADIPWEGGGWEEHEQGSKAQ